MARKAFDPLEILKKVRGSREEATVDGVQCIVGDITVAGTESPSTRSQLGREAKYKNGSAAELESDKQYEHLIHELPRDLVSKPVGPATLETIAKLQYELALAHSKLADQQVLIADLTETKRELEARYESLRAEKTNWRLEKHSMQVDLDNTRRKLHEALDMLAKKEDRSTTNPPSEQGISTTQEKKNMMTIDKKYVKETDENAIDDLLYAHEELAQLRFPRNPAPNPEEDDIEDNSDEGDRQSGFQSLSVSISPLSTRAGREKNRSQGKSSTSSHSSSTVSPHRAKSRPPFISSTRRGSLFRESVFHVENKHVRKQRQLSEEALSAAIASIDMGQSESNTRARRVNSLSSFASAGVLARQGQKGDRGEEEKGRRLKIPSSVRERQVSLQEKPHLTLDLD